MDQNTQKQEDPEFIELYSLQQRLITLLAYNSNEEVIQELASLYTLCRLAVDTLSNFRELCAMGEEGRDLADIIGFDFSEKMADIDDRIEKLKKNGISLLLH